MGNEFDQAWENIDIDDFDTNTENDNTNNTVSKKINTIIKKQDADKNVDMDYDKYLDDDNPDGYQSDTATNRWRNMITHIEASLKQSWKKEIDAFNYEMNKVTNAYKNNPNLAKHYLDKLNELKIRRQNLKIMFINQILELDTLKGEALGLIGSGNEDINKAMKVRKELATGKYEYKPTTVN